MNNIHQNALFIDAIKDTFGVWDELSTDTPYSEVIYSESFLGAINRLLFVVKKTEILGVSKNLQWGVIPEMKINGVAFNYKNNEVIGIYFGTLSLQCHFASLLFCSENFYPELISRDLNTDDYIESLHAISNEDIIYALSNVRITEENYSIKNFKIPYDKLRWQYAFKIGYYSAAFTFLHELGHLSRGHLDLCNTPDMFFEFDENRENTGVNSQILEIDADKTAMYFYLKIYAFEATIQKDIESKKIIYREIWFAIANFFLIADLRKNKKQSSSHPPPYVRYLFLRKMSHNIIARISHEELEIFLFVQLEIEKNIKDFLQIIDLPNIQFLDNSKEVEYYEKELQELYSKNQPILSKYYAKKADAQHSIYEKGA